MLIITKKILSSCKVIVVSTIKGGVGKTTTSVNLATILAVLGFKVLLIDTDPQSNATTNLGINPVNTLFNIIHHNKPVDECIVKTKFGIDIIPSEERVKKTLPYDVEDKNLFSEKFTYLREIYDFIIIDTLPTENKIVKNACSFADGIISPIFPTSYAVEGYKNLLKGLQEFKFEGIQVENLGILICKFANKSARPTFKKDLEKKYSDKIFKTFISESSVIEDTEAFDIPLIFYKKTHKVTKEYINFALELLKKINVLNKDEEKEMRKKINRIINSRTNIEFEREREEF